MRTVYALLLLITMLIWAGSFVFIKIGLNELEPYNLAFYRFLLASPVLILLTYFRGKLKLIDARDLPAIIVLALTGVTLLYAIQFLALTYTTATNASILINTAVIFVAIISFIYYGENFSKLKSIGVVLSFIGVIIIVSKGSIEFFSSRTFFGDVLMIFDGFLWAIYTVLGKKLLKKYHPETLTAYAFLFGSILLIPFALYEGLANPLTFSIATLVSILYLSILCSVFAYVVWYTALSKMDATKVSVYIYMIPLFTAIIAYFVLDEAIDIYTAIGGAVTIIGVYLTERY
jgi:drug/metabolite transporter (DMT)-like permease